MSWCLCPPAIFCLCMTLFPSFHLYPSGLCLALCSAFLSAPASFISLCHWAMCAVPVSKMAGRLSSFPRWRMRGQRGSCESYRLGSVKALPIGKLLLPVFLVCSHSDGVHFKMATCYSAVVVGLPPFSFVTSTCHMLLYFFFFNHNCFPSSIYISRILTSALCCSLRISRSHFLSLIRFQLLFFSFL